MISHGREAMDASIASEDELFADKSSIERQTPILSYREPTQYNILTPPDEFGMANENSLLQGIRRNDNFNDSLSCLDQRGT